MADPSQVTVLIVSDRRAAGTAMDEAGPLLAGRLGEILPAAEVAVELVPDEEILIVERLEALAAAGRSLVLTSGGTGLARRDVTPEATRRVIERPAPGLVHALLAAGLAATPFAMLGRPEAGVRGATLIVNLPGNPRGALESLNALAVVLPHALEILGADPGVDTGHPG